MVAFSASCICRIMAVPVTLILPAGPKVSVDANANTWRGGIQSGNFMACHDTSICK